MEQFTVSCSEPSGSAYTQPTRSWRRADTRPLTVMPVPGRVNSQPSGVSTTLVARAFPMPPIRWRRPSRERAPLAIHGVV